jgi:hypothetical protein
VVGGRCGVNEIDPQTIEGILERADRLKEALDLALETVRSMKQECDFLRAKNRYFVDKQFRDWLIRERPARFVLPIPLPIASTRCDGVALSLASRVEYRRADIVDQSISWEVIDSCRLDRVELLQTIDRNEHRSIEPMFEQYLSDQEVIVNLRNDLRSLGEMYSVLVAKKA